MKKNKKVSFIKNLFKGQKSFFSYYYEYLEKIDLKGKKILHLGSGWDKRNIRNRIKNADLISLDIDYPAIKRNINKYKVCGDAHSFPFKRESLDYIICEDFLEHVKNPAKLLEQINFVLKNDGEFIFVTPGGWSYIAIVSRLTPLRFHKWYNRIRGVDDSDVFQTFYRFNSVYRIKRKSVKSGLFPEKIVLITGYPSYFSFSKILTVIFGFIHYFIAKIGFLNRLIGINIFCILKKK